MPPRCPGIEARLTLNQGSEAQLDAFSMPGHRSQAHSKSGIRLTTRCLSMPSDASGIEARHNLNRHLDACRVPPFKILKNGTRPGIEHRMPSDRASEATAASPKRAL